MGCSLVLNRLCYLFSQAQLPFAVVGSNTILDVNGKKIRGRMYPWGIAEGQYMSVHLCDGSICITCCFSLFPNKDCPYFTVSRHFFKAIIEYPAPTVENPDHCDFIFLRNLLIRTHMQDLKDVTNNELYENYRCQKLAAVTSVSMDGRLASANRYQPLCMG